MAVAARNPYTVFAIVAVHCESFVPTASAGNAGKIECEFPPDGTPECPAIALSPITCALHVVVPEGQAPFVDMVPDQVP